jgi:hypothetical protein
MLDTGSKKKTQSVSLSTAGAVQIKQRADLAAEDTQL